MDSVDEMAGSSGDVVMAEDGGGTPSMATAGGVATDSADQCRDDGPPGMDDADANGGGDGSQEISGDEEFR